MQHLIWIIPLIPLLGAVINGLLGYRFIKTLGEEKGKRLIGQIACGTVFISFLISLFSFIHLLLRPIDQRVLVNTVYTWFHIGNLKTEVSFLIDPLSGIMILVVTGVGFLIHFYSIGYMGHDEYDEQGHRYISYWRYFSYLNLFAFSMLLLVLADNILLMFVGWEGVGLCSYLLISFWYRKQANAVAGMKAFVVNRIGDFGFLIGIFALFWALGRHGIWTVNFRQIGEHAHLLAEDTILGIPAATFITLFLFLGAIGKSAQIPLYVWLPDAMAGPTPVSALIHAATMVTAGVYMIGRLNFLYSMAPVTLTIVALIGAATAFFAATIGLVQNDIKRILAYSTVSQLGYMFLGMGVAAYGTGIFHLMTHAFFKALLFLGAGSVIHAMGGKQDIRDMGGLRKYLPTTFRTFLIGWLAICGIFPFAGFFSKDEILWSVFNHSNPVLPFLPKLLWLIGLLGAGLTAFYMSRLVFMTFFGELRSEPAEPHGGHGNDARLRDQGDTGPHGHGDGELQGHGNEEVISLSPQREPHESPWTMTYPLVGLAVLSVVGGWFGVPHFLDPVFGGHGGVVSPAAETGEHSTTLEIFLMMVSMAVALGGMAVAAVMYLVMPELPDLLSIRFSRLYDLLLNKYYVDEIYQAVFVNGLLALTTASTRFDLKFIDGIVNESARVTAAFSAFNGWLDLRFVDGIVNTLASGTVFSGSRLRKVQTGQVQSYLFAVLGGVVVIILIRTFI